MPLSHRIRAGLATTLSLCRIVAGSIQLNFPINSQVPPVAYVSQPYEFTFSSTTFKNDGSSIIYELAHNPAWLSIDSANRKLSGTPTSNDAGSPSFNLLASDKTGQTSSSVTLVVLEQNTIGVGEDLLPQLAGTQDLSPPETLLLQPLQYFSFEFSRATFIGTKIDTVFYATSADGSPLPSWLQFNPSSLQFSGTTPPHLGSSSSHQSYSFSFAASNVIGFSEATAQFQIIVGSSVLCFTSPHINITISDDNYVRSNPLLQQLFLNGKAVSRQDLSTVTSTAPAWLRFNDTDLSFSGNAPSGFQGSSFSISASGASSNTANLTVTLLVEATNAVTRIELGSFNAHENTYFSHVIERPSNIDASDSVSADLGALSSWLSFDPVNLTLHGAVPNDIIAQSSNASILFKSAGAAILETFVINIITLTESPSIDSSGSFISRTSSVGDVPTDTATITPGSYGLSKKPLNIVRLVLSIVLPIIGLLFALCLILLFLRERRKKKKKTTTQSKNTRKSSQAQDHTSGPMTVNGIVISLTPSQSQTNRSQKFSGPPRVDLAWATDSIKGTRRRLSKRPRNAHSSMIGPSWDDLIRLPTQVIQPDNMLVSTPNIEKSNNLTSPPTRVKSLDACTEIPRKSSARRLAKDSIHGPHTYRVSKNPRASVARASALPKRMSGAGHGAGINNPIRSQKRSSWQTTLGTMPLGDSRPSTVMLESFPTPPSQRDIAHIATRDDDVPTQILQPTLWLVADDINQIDDIETDSRFNHTDQAREKLEGVNSSYLAITDHADIPPRSRLRSTLSPRPLSCLKDGEVNTRQNHDIWSQWSAIIPTTHLNTNSQIPTHNVNQSLASSHQFSSAPSSTSSQWEDDAFIADETFDGERVWQHQHNPLSSASGTKPSPRLPFESIHGDLDKDDRNGVDGETGLNGRRLNLRDRRKKIGINLEKEQERNLTRELKSQQGSFRFI